MDLPSRSFRHMCAFRRFRTRGLDTTRSAAGCNSNETSSRTGDTSPYSVIPNQRVAINARGLHTIFSTIDDDRNLQLMMQYSSAIVYRSQPTSRKPPNSDHVSKGFRRASRSRFNICSPGSRGSYPIVFPWEDWEQRMHKMRTSKTILRPGMVLMKDYLSHKEQVRLVRGCRLIGNAEGGFYKPPYRDGATPDIYLMSLGLNWNPETLTYEYGHRSVDGDAVLPIIEHFNVIETVLPDARKMFSQDGLHSDGEDDLLKILPQMRANVCIANFYPSSTSKLGLHQDCSERSWTLRAGLPVISLSIGDSAEFMYGDDKDEDNAERVLLESGDVLVFGGESRHIYHGVSSIIPNSAPKKLLEETGLLPGRLNLTYREA